MYPVGASTIRFRVAYGMPPPPGGRPDNRATLPRTFHPSSFRVAAQGYRALSHIVSHPTVAVLNRGGLQVCRVVSRQPRHYIFLLSVFVMFPPRIPVLP